MGEAAYREEQPVKITKPGTRPPEVVYRYKCSTCGCEGELTEAEWGRVGEVSCPMEWCDTVMVLVEETTREVV